MLIRLQIFCLEHGDMCTLREVHTLNSSQRDNDCFISFLEQRIIVATVSVFTLHFVCIESKRIAAGVIVLAECLFTKHVQNNPVLWTISFARCHNPSNTCVMVVYVFSVYIHGQPSKQQNIKESDCSDCLYEVNCIESNFSSHSSPIR